MITKDNKWIRFIKNTFAFLTCALILFFILGEIFLPNEGITQALQQTDSEQKSVAFVTEWVHVRQDGLLEPAAFPGSVEAERGEDVVYQTTLPKAIYGQTNLCFRSYWQDMRFYVDGIYRQSYSTQDSRAFGTLSPTAYIFVPIHASDAGKTLTVITRTDSSFAGKTSEVLIGDKYSIWLSFFKQYGMVTLLQFIIMCVSILCVGVCVVLTTVFKKPFELKYLALCTFFLSVWLFSENEFRQLLFPNVSVLTALTFYSLILGPLSLGLYINELQKKRYEKLYGVLFGYALFDVLAVTVLEFTKIVQFLDSLILTHIFILVTIVMILFTMLMDIKKKLFREYYLVGVGLVVVVLAGVAEVVLYYKQSFLRSGTAMCIGIIFLLFFACFKTGRDILESEANKQRVMLENEAKTKFLANMSHELRTPINTILGMNEMILRENRDENVQLYARGIQNAGKNLLSLIRDILDFSEIDAGRMHLSPTPYSLSDLILDAIGSLKAKAETHELKVNFLVDEKLPNVLQGDEKGIRQIVNQLTSNAVKYTKEGSVSLSFGMLGIEHDMVQLLIEVEDTGCGIKKEDQEIIYQSFSRLDTDKNRSIEGTGLGLSITKRLVDEMNGEIRVESEYQKGSRFLVIIPQKVVGKETVGDLGSRAENKKEIHHISFIAPEVELLVVDDNEMNIKVVQGLLKGTEISIMSATGGAECLALCSVHKFDLILMDHMMPEMDGVETLQHLRKLDGYENVPVVILTANAVAGSKERYLTMGFSAYLSKPLDPEALETVLKDVLPTKKWIDLSKSDSSEEDEDLKEENEEIIQETGDSKSLIDTQTGLTYCAGSEEMYLEILKTYLSQRDKYMFGMREYYEKKDWDNYAILVHALKSTSLSIGAKELSEEAKQMEMAAKAMNVAVLDSGFDDLCLHYESVLKEIQNIIEPTQTEEIPDENVIKRELESDHEDRLSEAITTQKHLTYRARKLILVVDDDTINLTLAEKLLSADYDIKKISSGEEALAFLETTEPDLILLDIQMPEMDGFAVMSVIRSHSSYCKIPVIFLTADRSEKTEETCFEMGAVDYIGKPFVPAILRYRVRRTLELEDYRKNLERMVQKQLQRITQLQQDIIFSMANLIESRDGTTGEHVKRTTIYAGFLMDKMLERGVYAQDLTSTFIDYMKKAAPLHDIGKITVPDRILQKPGKLDAEEYEMMKGHAAAGGKLIRENMTRIVDREFVDMAEKLAAHHHEKWNGGGYPDGLSGKNIPLCARILAVVDVFDALVSKRQYKEGMSFEKAYDIMKHDRGEAFEPILFDTFFANKNELVRLMQELNGPE